MEPSRWSNNWPIILGMAIVGASCVLLKAPHDLTADNSIDAFEEQGSFRTPDGSVTPGGTLSGEWVGICEMYGYPYGLELTLTDSYDGVTGEGLWVTGWGEFPGEVTGTTTDGIASLTLLVDYYGYDYAIQMEAGLDGTSLTGSCDVLYGTGGYLELERR